MKLIQKLSLISLLLGASSLVTEPSDDNLPTVEVSCDGNDYEYYYCRINTASDVLQPVVFHIKDADKRRPHVNYVHITTSRFIMRALPMRLFEQLPNIDRLEIQSSETKILHKDVFIGAHKLERLDLSMGIETIEENTFSDVPKLWNLVLEHNKIKSFEPNTFIGCTNVTDLILDDNQLVTIRQNDFVGLTNLQFFFLRRNKIKSIEDGALNFTHLTKLYLDHNQLQQLSDHTFAGTPELRYLSIDHNNLARVGSSFQHLTKLKFISLAWNHIVDLDFTALLQMPELTFIYLRSSGLTSIHSEYTPGVTYAVYDLDLAHNGIQQSDLLTRLRNCGNLTKLRLYGNSYDKLDELERIGELLPKLQRVSVGSQYTYSEAQSMASKSGKYISPDDFLYL